MLEADLACIAADTPSRVSVVFAGASVQGISLAWKDMPEPDAGGGIAIVSRRTLTLLRGVLDGLVEDASISVNGTIYRIHRVLACGPQGLLTEVILA